MQHTCTRGVKLRVESVGLFPSIYDWDVTVSGRIPLGGEEDSVVHSRTKSWRDDFDDD